MVHLFNILKVKHYEQTFQEKMKTRLLKCMPHVPLRQLEPDLEEKNAGPADEDINEAVDERNSDVTANDFVNINEDLFQNPKDVGSSSSLRKLFGKIVKKFDNKRHGNSSRIERSGNGNYKVVQKYSFVNNETSESDSEEEFQEGIPLVRRIETKIFRKTFEKVGIRRYGRATRVERPENVNCNEGQHILHESSVKPKEGLWAFIHGKSRFSGLQSPLGITNGNRNHNKPLELI